METLRSGWLTRGDKAKEFELRFAEKIGARYAIAVNSATSALHLALDAIGVTRGDEVLVPTMTFAATAEVVVHLGAKPVLLDCLEENLCVDPAGIEEKITPRTKAIMPVHFAGYPCEMDQICDIASRNGLKVIEDAAHALPTRYRDRLIGTIGDVTCFSFYASKTITTGEGGMLVTHSEPIAKRARMMSMHGLSRDAWDRFVTESRQYEILDAGYKYNLSDIAASLGVVQLDRCEELLEMRTIRANRYYELLQDVREITLPTVSSYARHSWHLFLLKLDLDRLRIGRDDFLRQMNDRRIEATVHYRPLHLNPYYQTVWGYTPEDFPVATDVYERILSIPLYPSMSEQQQERVARAVRDIVEANRK